MDNNSGENPNASSAVASLSSPPPPPTQEQALPPYQAQTTTQTTTEVLSASDPNSTTDIYDDRAAVAAAAAPHSAPPGGLDLGSDGAPSDGTGASVAGTSVQVALQSFIVANPAENDDGGDDEHDLAAAAAAAAASTPLQGHLQTLVGGTAAMGYHTAGVVDDSPSSLDHHHHHHHHHDDYSETKPDIELREQDRFLPIANVARIMKKTIPVSGKVSKGAKECVQECVSEFISFITSEASERCQQEKRKTINGEDILFAMQSLGFDNYIEPLKVFLQRYRDSTKSDRLPGTAPPSERLLPDHEEMNASSPDHVTEGGSGANPPYISLMQTTESAAGNHAPAASALYMSQYTQQVREIE